METGGLPRAGLPRFRHTLAFVLGDLGWHHPLAHPWLAPLNSPPVSPALSATLEGHTSSVQACACSPDGTRVVSASGDRTLRVWDVAGATTVATLEGHTDWVWGCAFSPDGTRVVSASGDRTLRVWDVAGAFAVSVIGLGGPAFCTDWHDELVVVGAGSHLARPSRHGHRRRQRARSTATRLPGPMAFHAEQACRRPWWERERSWSPSEREGVVADADAAIAEPGLGPRPERVEPQLEKEPPVPEAPGDPRTVHRFDVV